MKKTLLSLLPKRVTSQLAGYLADLKVNPALLEKIIMLYSKKFSVNMEESKYKPKNFDTFNDFFTRELVAAARPIDKKSNVLISPVDGTFAQIGNIEDGILPQAKNIYYSLPDLIGEKKAADYENGSFATIYLSPGDYHRIHSPFSGEIREVCHFPGNLWPVNELGVNNIGGLFAINERIASFLSCEDHFEVGIVKVGALIVGKIKLEYLNADKTCYRGSKLNFPLEPAYKVSKGDELGCFKLGGSTVILLFQKGRMKFDDFLKAGSKIKYGQAIGKKL